MDIVKLQKVNQLARELKSFGMAGTMDEAYNQADSYIDGQSELTFLRKSDAKREEPAAQPQAAPTQELKAEAAAVPGNDLEQKFVHLSSLYREQEARLANMADIIMKMQHAMNDIITEQGKMKGRGDGFITSQPQQRAVAIENASSGEVVAMSEPKPVVQAAPKSEPKANPRCGDFKQEDVSIDKMFYFGNKR